MLFQHDFLRASPDGGGCGDFAWRSAHDSDESFSSRLRYPELRSDTIEPFEPQDLDLDARELESLELEENEVSQLLPHWVEREDPLTVQRLVSWPPLVQLPRPKHRSYAHSVERIRVLEVG